MSDKTEAPTPRRIAEAREQGQVVNSREVNAAVILLLSVALLQGPGRNLVTAISEMIEQIISELPGTEITSSWLQETTLNNSLRILPSLGLIILGIMVTGVIATLAQTRFLWSSKRKWLDFNRINPINGFKRLFSRNSLFELIKTLAKLLIIGWITYSFLKSNYMQLVGLASLDIREAISQAVKIFFALMLRVSLVYFVLAAADFAYQRWDYMRNLRMSKQEIKEEMKRSEGDPLLKSRIRSQQRRMARRRMMANVPNATVIVTNPTHLAIAVEYRNDMHAPKILAKGAYKIAERIVAIAKDHSIPIVQNIPLAWAIYKTIDIDQEISPDLYKAMAEVLAFVYKSKNLVSQAANQTISGAGREHK
ncbi:MAG: flagellar biosynthesis protein FlhB [Anaerolineaceae bacterium]